MLGTVVSERIIEYVQDLYCLEDGTLSNIAHTFNDIHKNIHVGPLIGRILNLIIKMNKVKSIVEVGTLAGYSTIWMAKALPNDGKIYTFECDEKHAITARKNFIDNHCEELVSIYLGDAIHELSKFNRVVDMFFIDANKNAYGQYLDFADDYVKKGGLIVADNVLQRNTVVCDTPPAKNDRVSGVSDIAWKSLCEFNKRISNTEKYDSVILPLRDGLSISIKKF